MDKVRFILRDLTDRIVEKSFSEDEARNIVIALQDIDWSQYHDLLHREYCTECFSRVSRLTTDITFIKRYQVVCVDCRERFTKRCSASCYACGLKYIPFDALRRYICDDCLRQYPLAWNQVESQRQRARDAGLPDTLHVGQWIVTLNHFKGKCAYCVERPYEILEHYLPVSLRGGTTQNNCVPACKRCNLRKKDKHPDVFTRLFPTQNMARIRGYLERVSSLALR